jgi:hypothetical protein
MENLSVNLSEFERQYKIKKKLFLKIRVPWLKTTFIYYNNIMFIVKSQI